LTHILFITPYYPPEKAAPAIRISETAARLVQRGYQVTVLTTVPNYPVGIVPPEYRGRRIWREVRDGVRVVRVWSYVSENKGFLRRILAQISFGCLAPLLGGKEVGRPDIIIVQSPPLFDAIAGRMLAWLKRCPFIFVVSDIWPESAVQLGMLNNRLMIWLSERLEWSTYRKAGAVWVVTEGIRQRLIKRGLSPDHMFLLTNGVDTTKFRPMPQSHARARLDWDDRYTVLYAGTHGLAHGLTTVLDAAESIRDRTDIRFVLVGDGATKADLVAQAQRRNLDNIEFLDSQPHELMPVLLAAADVCLVPLRKVPLFEGALPSKMYEIMACGRPIVLGVNGEARQLTEVEAGASFYVEPEDPTALVSGIFHMKEHPELAEILGKRGRALVEARFDRDQLSTVLEGHIAALLGNDLPGPASPDPSAPLMGIPSTPVAAITERK
jgi:putative colanic acid biosynthesis glycosyltransferase WcaI